MMESEWRRNEKRYGNKMKSQIYNDQMAKYAGQSGLGMQASQLATQGTQDRNSAIQGLANMGMSYGMNQDANDQRQKDRDTYGYKRNSNNPWGDA